jgi:hypothetical protein
MRLIENANSAGHKEVFIIFLGKFNISIWRLENATSGYIVGDMTMCSASKFCVSGTFYH